MHWNFVLWLWSNWLEAHLNLRVVLFVLFFCKAGANGVWEIEIDATGFVHEESLFYHWCEHEGYHVKEHDWLHRNKIPPVTSLWLTLLHWHLMNLWHKRNIINTRSQKLCLWWNLSTTEMWSKCMVLSSFEFLIISSFLKDVKL